MVEEIVKAMKMFDEAIPVNLKKEIVADEAKYTEYKDVIEKLDELYTIILYKEDMNVEIAKNEAVYTLEKFASKYGVNVDGVKTLIESA